MWSIEVKPLYENLYAYSLNIRIMYVSVCLLIHANSFVLGETVQEVTAMACGVLSGSEVMVGEGDALHVDITYWRKAAVAAAVGTLYECAQRENSFVSLVQRSGCVLTMITSDDRRPSRQPISLCPLAELLLHHDSLCIPPILLISRYIELGTMIGVRDISLSVMSSALLKHVASLQNVDVFSTALISDGQGLEELRRGCISVLIDAPSSRSYSSAATDEEPEVCSLLLSLPYHRFITNLTH